MAAILFPTGNRLGYQQVGSVGMNALQQAQAAGAPLAGCKGVDNFGVAIDGQKYGALLRVSRSVQGATEAAPGMDDNPSDDTLRAMAARQVEYYLHHLNSDETSALTHIEPWNEPAPHTDGGWAALAKLNMFTCDAAEANHFKAVLLSLNCGGYEWSQILAALDVRVNGESLTARAARGGHRFGMHEGLLPPYPDRLDATIFGCALPGSPYLTDAHYLVMRWLFWRLAAQMRGQTLPPVDTTEMYPLIEATAHYGAAVPAGRAAYYDSLMARYSEGGVTFLYGVGQTGVGLPRNDMSSVWPALVPLAVAVRNRQNAVPTNSVPPPLPPVSTHNLLGLHLRADGPNAPADFRAAQLARVQAVKFTSGARPADVVSALALNTNMLLVVRIFQSFAGRNIAPSDFVAWNAPDIQRFYAQGVRLFEVHNEPNLYSEGLGSAWANGQEFGDWFLDVCQRLRAMFPAINLGWPGLSPGGDLAGVRQAATTFADNAGSRPMLAEWIGQHVYWQSATELQQAVPAQLDDYQRRYPGKPIYITECSNQSTEPGRVKGQQYVQFYQMLAQRPVPPVSAFFYVASASSGYLSEVWRLENGTMTDIPAVVGARSDMPASNQSKVINCTAVNVRRWPWTGGDQPPVVRQLKAGDIVTVAGVYRSPVMANGWACLNPASDEWINAYYLGPV